MATGQSGHDDDEFVEPPHLRRLRLLVTGLVVVLILGVLTVVAVIVIRLGLGFDPALSPQIDQSPIEASAFPLPGDHEILAVGRGAETVLFTLRAPDGSELLMSFDAATGDVVSTSEIHRN